MIAIIIAALSGPLLMIILAVACKIYSTRKRVEPPQSEIKPFVASEYFSRMEQAALDILEAQEPVDQTIILWWGLDGLQLNEDGSLEWVSRKRPEPVTAEVLYQSCQSIQNAPKPDWYNQAQNTDLQIRMALNAKNVAIVDQLQPPMPGYFGYSPYAYVQPMFTSPLQQYCVQYPAQYPPYYYGGCRGNYFG